MRKLNLMRARGFVPSHKLEVRKPRRRMGVVIGAVLLCLAGWQFADAAFIHGKAWMAQHLLQQAWQATLEGKPEVKPWPWADTWPTARLQVPRLNEDAIVLSGAGGNVLAFAPGHISHSAMPGERGLSIISAHRDTHFAFLQQISMSDEVIVTNADGEKSVYEVIAIDVVDARNFKVVDQPSRSILLLTTCYPFNAITTGGPLRFVVTTEKKGHAEEEVSA